MHHKSTLSLLIAGSLLAAACSGSPAKPDAPVETSETPDTETAEVSERGISPYAPFELRDGEAEVVDLGDYEGVRALKIGDVHVLHKQTPANDVVAAQLYIQGGSLNLTEATAGIEQLALNVAVNGGTESTDKDALNTTLNSIGSGLSYFVERDFSGVSMKSVVDHFDPTWELFVQTVLEPSFPQEEIELRRTRQISEIRSIFDNPDSHVGHTATRLLFENHPYYHLHMGTEENVSAFTREELRAYQRSIIKPERLLLVVVGNIPTQELTSKVMASFGRLASSESGPVELPGFDVEGVKKKVETRELPTNYIFGLYPAPAMGDEDYAAMLVATRHLRDRLFEEVRTKRNLTYAVSAGLSNKRANYGFLYVTAVDPGATMPVIFEEVERLKSTPLTEEELREVRNVFLTRHYMDLQTNSSQASMLAEAALIGGDWRLSESFLEAVQAVSPEDIQRVAATYFKDYHFGIVGNPELVNGELFGVNE